MRGILKTCIIFLLTIGFAFSQPGNNTFDSALQQTAFQSRDPELLLISSHPEKDITKYTQYQNEINRLADKLYAKTKNRSPIALLEKVFYHTHRKKLDWYENYAEFRDLLNKGKYDCVTGTAFYALILEKLQIDYTIYEFDFHTLLIARNGTDSVMFEATDPMNGFVKDPEEMRERILIYGNGLNPNEIDRSKLHKLVDQSKYHINNKVTLTELIGLYFYNQSVKAFNNRDHASAISLIEKANLLYPSSRIKQIRKIYMSEQNGLITQNN